jgi:hypothetical protein
MEEENRGFRMGRVDRGGARMGVLGEDWHPRHQPLERGNNHLVPLGRCDVELQHLHQTKVRQERVGKGHYASKEVAHRTGSKGVQGHILDKECMGAGARKLGPYACQCSACTALHLKNRNFGTRRRRGWFEPSKGKK